MLGGDVVMVEGRKEAVTKAGKGPKKVSKRGGHF